MADLTYARESERPSVAALMNSQYNREVSRATIVFEDTHLVVIDKPAGLLSQGEITGDDNLVDQLRAHFGRHYVGLVHRLDRGTSGLMVVAKRSKSANRLTESLQCGDLKRWYRAWVRGTPTVARDGGQATGDRVEWTDWIIKDPKTNVSRVVEKKSPGAKECRLSAALIRSWERSSLLEIVLDTGRSHQIRVQLAHRGHPLLGDTKYGGPAAGITRPALHSARIEFPHPMSEELLRFEAAPPEDLARLELSLNRA